MVSIAQNDVAIGVGAFNYHYEGLTDILTRLDLPNGTQTVQSYDALQRLTQVVNKKTGGADLNKFTYAYDTRDVRTGVQMKYGADPLRQVDYSYDAVDQLVGEAATGGTAGTTYSNAYSYDAMGNRLKRENTQGTTTALTRSSVNELNQLTTVSTSVDGGPRVTGGMNYDAAGNLTETTTAGGGRTLYVYDDADRLFRIEKRDAADAPLSKSEFIYDYASRKAVSQEFTYTAGAWVKSSEKRRVFDGLDVIQERDELNQVTAQLVRDGNIAGILSRSTAVGASFYGYDGSGNVTLLTDINGNEVGRYRYDAFGNTLEASGARAAENPYRFSTKELHGASGLYDFGFRFYSASLGRWVNRDPIREAGGTNLYGFVANSPVNLVDSYGLYVTFTTDVYTRPKDGKKIKFVRAHIPAVFVGNGASARTVARVKRAIEDAWFGSHGGDTILVVYIEAPSKKELECGKYNTIHLVNKDFRSHAELGGDDAYVSTSNVFQTEWIAAHEIGHIMGLPDQYDNVVINGKLYSKPRPGWAWNIMAQPHGRADEKNIRDLIRIHNLDFK